MRILKGWTDEERKELEEAKDGGFNNAIVLINGIADDDDSCTSLTIKYMTESPDEDNQLARDIADYYNGEAKFPDCTQQSLIERSAGFMPGVYKDWIKSLKGLTQEEQLTWFHNIIFYPEINGFEDRLLYEWLTKDGSKSSFMLRISECIEAICYGYEVSAYK